MEAEFFCSGRGGLRIQYFYCLFCPSPVEFMEHLFFDCPLANGILSWVQSHMFNASPLCPSLAARHVRFGFLRR